ncbi:unnamed protein product [Effrenium voratum]|uniref:F-box/LRR-repeat protein 15-like leucin rich repeat domain-containing protein n=1 Tax=Effrenium voratum TaxID=2562239 RepID=A0AA36MPC7_9DINO|nr:unnamed protein product [Effrenium voratum]
MDAVPWHLHTSYLKSGWHGGSTYATVLPDVRQPRQLGQSGPAARIPEKELRPRSAGTRREQALDPRVQKVCRLLPLPRIQDISGMSVEAQGVFQEAAMASDERLAEALKNPDNQQIVANTIQRIRLSDLSWLSAEPLAKMADNMKQLRELNLRGTRADDKSLASIFAGCPKLEKLDISCCTLADVGGVQELLELRDFRASSCQAVTEDLVRSLSQLRWLEVVELSYTNGVTDQALVQMASGCRGLKHLALECCPRFADVGLLAITQANSGIQKLLLALNRISDDAASQAMSSLKRLRVLDLAGCHQLSRRLPDEISRQCEYLEDLSLASISMIRDDHVRRILLSCKRLRRLDLSGCKNLSVNPFLEVIPHARALRRLNLSLIQAITDQAVTAIYRASVAGDGGFDAAAIAAKLRADAAAAEAEEEGSEEASEEESGGEDENDNETKTPERTATYTMPLAQDLSAGDGAESLLVIDRFAQTLTNPTDLKDIIYVRRLEKGKKGKKKKKGAKTGKK